jgi:hypothetical protein
MALSNAEKQRRWRERNLIPLTADAREIARRLAAMDDQVKLALIVAFLNARLNPKDGRCKFVKDDGGRGSDIPRRGRKDEVGDCVARAIAIATQKPYREVHDALTVAKVRDVAAGKDHWTRRARRKGGISAFHADHGVSDEVYGPYLQDLGWKFTSTKDLPRGRGVHLRADELPQGRLIVRLPNHLVAVINGVIHDTHDCSDEGRCRIRGYWTPPVFPALSNLIRGAAR